MRGVTSQGSFARTNRLSRRRLYGLAQDDKNGGSFVRRLAHAHLNLMPLGETPALQTRDAGRHARVDQREAFRENRSIYDQPSAARNATSPGDNATSPAVKESISCAMLAGPMTGTVGKGWAIRYPSTSWVSDSPVRARNSSRRA